MINFLINSYARLFSKPLLSKFNGRLLQAALKARGFDNAQNGSLSGEDFFIKRILRPANLKVCVDVGANVGDFTQALLKHTNAIVISFEPLPQPFKKLEKTAQEFGDRSHLVNKGVGAEDSTLEIHYNSETTIHASFSTEIKEIEYIDNNEVAKVEMVSLDSYFEHRQFEAVDFIKIDTEGFESEVILGALSTIKHYKPRYIQIEYNWHQLFRGKSLKYFADLLPDYSVYQLIPNGWVKRDPNHPHTNIFQFSNFVFVLE